MPKKQRSVLDVFDTPTMKEYRVKGSSTLLGFLNLRTSPYKMDEILPFDKAGRKKKCGGLYWNCPHGRPIVVEMQQAFWSYVLAVILILDSILLSSWFGLVNYKYTSDVCEYNATKVDTYMEAYKKEIGYYAALNVSNLTGEISNEQFTAAEEQYIYDDVLGNYIWPTPFQNTFVIDFVFFSVLLIVSCFFRFCLTTRDCHKCCCFWCVVTIVRIKN